jgi:hypothetical protein
VAHVRAEHVPEPLVAALADEVEVHLAQRREPAVRVVDDVDAVAVADPDAVVATRSLDDAGEEPGVVHLHQRVRVVRVAVAQNGDLVGVRPEHADDGPVGMRVGAQNAMRVVVGTTQQPVGRRLVRGAGVDRAGVLELHP